MELLAVSVPDLHPRLSRRLLLDLMDHATEFLKDIQTGVDIDALDPPNADAFRT